MGKHVQAGGGLKAKVNVANTGTKAVSTYTVEFYRDEKLIGNAEGHELQSGEEAGYDFTDQISINSPLEVTYSAKIVCADDQDETDNVSAKVKANVVYNSDYPKITGLAASVEEGRVNLSWDEPATVGTEQFEYVPAFSNTEFGKWVAIDKNGGETIVALDGYDETEYPNAGQPAAFIAFNAEQLGLENSNLAPRSGKQALAAFANKKGQNDGWLISPEVEGLQTVSFYAKAANPDFPERLEVLCSSTDCKPESFVRIGDVHEIAEGDWEKVEADLPENARHFAIRCVSYDCYALLIDDVRYKSKGLELKGYNVYRDGMKVNEELVADNNFTDKPSSNGTYAYNVTAVYNLGESVLSESLSINTAASSIDTVRSAFAVSTNNGKIVVSCAGNSNVEVCTTDGVLVHKLKLGGEEKVSIPVGSGLYIVKWGSQVAKVAVK